MREQDRRKIMAGGRMRKLRAELNLSQAAMAAELGVSVSYLNLVERNQRPVTAQLLIKLSEVYAIDPRTFAQEEDQRHVTEVEEIFVDPIFAQHPVPRQDIRNLIESSPAMGVAIRQLYNAYRGLMDERAKPLTEGGTIAPHGEVDQLRAFLQDQSNHFPTLEEIAENIADDLKTEGDDLYSALARRLATKHNMRCQVVPANVLPQMLRRYDVHRRKIMVSELLEPGGRAFQLAFQIGLMEASSAIDDIVKRIDSTEKNRPLQRLARVMLGNYFAAALMMPYGQFYEAARAESYDVEILAARFGASFEQVAHRLTTLARPSQKGIPFFMIRVDVAGNVSKRFSSGAFPFSRFGGSCPRWNIHHSFAMPGRVQTQVLELNNGSKWFSIARTVQRLRMPWGEQENQFVIGIGCELKYADRLVYGRNLKETPTPIGVTCRLCDIANCAQRAAPASGRPLDVNEFVRGFSPFDAVLGR